MLNVKQTASALYSANKEHAVNASKLVAGNIINQRILKLVKPRLPKTVQIMISDNSLADAAICNVIAGILIHTMSSNKRVVQAADCMIAAASQEVISGLNIEGLINDILDGITLPDLTPQGE